LLSRPSSSYILPSLTTSSFFFYSSGAHRDLHSFPTRRSSDLRAPRLRGDAAPVPCRHGQLGGHDRADRPRHDAFRGRQRNASWRDRKSTRLNSSHLGISYAVFCLKKKKKKR